MDYSHIPAQKFYFYPSKWTAEIDALFLSSLIQHKKNGEWSTWDIPTDALHVALGDVNQRFGYSFSWDDVYERKVFMETRYRMYKEIIDAPQTHWDIRQNCIHADDKIWKGIFKKNIFAQAYYHNSEPEFEKLATLFGSNDIKIESGNTVIIISDSTQATEGRNNMTITILDSEEVTSPNPPHLGSVRRRLFDNEDHPKDMESTNDRGPYYFAPDPNGIRKSPLVNAFPPKFKENVSKHTKAVGTSSCASSSPSKWWKNPFI